MPQSLTCWETARRLNVKPLWVHRLIDRGDLKVVGDGVTEESVKKLLRRREARKRPAGYVSIKRASYFSGSHGSVSSSSATRAPSAPGPSKVESGSMERASSSAPRPSLANRYLSLEQSNPRPHLLAFGLNVEFIMHKLMNRPFYNAPPRPCSA